MRKILFGIHTKLKNRLQLLGQNNAGMGTVEVILIIVVLVGLVIIFRDQITDIVSSLFSKITGNVNKL